MSYALNPQVIRAAAPGAANDNTQGFVVGSIWVDTTATPDAAYICTSAATGAATWVSAGGVTAHPSLATLGWSASGHTGTTNSVACFNSASGAAQTVQATAEGSVLTFTGGVLTFAVFAATVAYVSERSTETYYVDILSSAATDFVLPGSMI
jgi:hypothetical protein